MRLLTVLPLFALLAACGVDGAPEQPKPATKPAVSLSGDARMGVQSKL